MCRRDRIRREPTGLMDKCITAKKTAVTHLPTSPYYCYDDGLEGALLIEVGPFSIIKWARFR